VLFDRFGAWVAKLAKRDGGEEQVSKPTPELNGVNGKLEVSVAETPTVAT